VGNDNVPGKDEGFQQMRCGVNILDGGPGGPDGCWHGWYTLAIACHAAGWHEKLMWPPQAPVVSAWEG
jgi:hypothetical protein